MFVMSSMITLKDWPRYSHATPFAPAGNAVPPLKGTPVGLGRVIPRADPTVTAVGHVLGAGVEVAVEDGIESDVAVGDGVEATVEPPQAVTDATKTSAVSANHRELSCDTFNASFASRRLDATWASPSSEPATQRFTPAMLQRSSLIRVETPGVQRRLAL